jgi:hypothetical protein
MTETYKVEMSEKAVAAAMSTKSKSLMAAAVIEVSPLGCVAVTTAACVLGSFLLLYSREVLIDAAWQLSAENESDPHKGKGLASKVMRMKEDITREVLDRATAMADREEKAVLMTAIKALNKSDSTRALKVHSCSPLSSSAQKLLRKRAALPLASLNSRR